MLAQWMLSADPEDDEETPPADYPEDDHAGNQGQ